MSISAKISYFGNFFSFYHITMQNSTQQIVMQILLLRISFQDPVPWLNSGLSPDSPDDAFVSWKADPPLCVCIPLPFTTLLWELFPKLRPHHGHYPAKKKNLLWGSVSSNLELDFKDLWLLNNKHDPNAGSFLSPFPFLIYIWKIPLSFKTLFTCLLFGTALPSSSAHVPYFSL